MKKIELLKKSDKAEIPAGSSKLKNKNIHQKAFTLAEVLITLGVIGIVAALTIPNLMGAYRKKVVETRLARFSSVINQAIRRSEVDNESVEYWGPNLISTAINDEDGKPSGNYSSNALEWYNRYLAPYLSVLRVEEVNTQEQRVLVYFTDGSLLNFSSRSWLFYPDAKYYDEVEKEGALNDRDRSECGRRYFTFQLYTKSNNSNVKISGGVYPFAQFLNIPAEKLKTDSALGCTKEIPTNERAYCTLLIAENGWKIPKDYPLKF